MPDANNELTGREIQLIGDILEPRLTEAARQHVDRLGEQCASQFQAIHETTQKTINDAKTEIVAKLEQDLNQQTTDINAKIDVHDDRLKKLESNQKKALAAYGVIVAAITTAWQLGKDKLFREMGLKK